MGESAGPAESASGGGRRSCAALLCSGWAPGSWLGRGGRGPGAASVTLWASREAGSAGHVSTSTVQWGWRLSFYPKAASGAHDSTRTARLAAPRSHRAEAVPSGRVAVPWGSQFHTRPSRARTFSPALGALSPLCPPGAAPSTPHSLPGTQSSGSLQAAPAPVFSSFSVPPSGALLVEPSTSRAHKSLRGCSAVPRTSRSLAPRSPTSHGASPRGGRPCPASARATLAEFPGSWRDSAGAAGALAFVAVRAGPLHNTPFLRPSSADFSGTCLSLLMQPHLHLVSPAGLWTCGS